MSDTPLHPGSDPDALTERLRWPITALLAAFMITGAFSRQPHSALASLTGIALAVPCCYLGTELGSRFGIAWLLLSAVGVILNAGGTAASTGHFGLCALAVAAVPCLGVRRGSVVIAGLFSVLIYKFFDAGVQTGWFPWLGGLLISSAGGALYAREASVLVALRDAQATLAQRSRVEERGRIARDLHDVIAHSLTVSLLHVTAARLAVEHDPADAARALREAERLGRESLQEVRSIVGLMRTGSSGADAEDPGFTPIPGLERIPELVERFRAAGVFIDLEPGESATGVPGTVGATAYRITQEALTNAARHAPGAWVRVQIRARDADWLELVVDSGGPPGSGTGSGLASMCERAEAVGGQLSAEPTDFDGGPGWRVRAELPTGGGRWRI